MARIQEIAEELVNLSVKEVNELAHVIRYDISNPMKYDIQIIDNISSPKDYGISLYEKKHKKRR